MRPTILRVCTLLCGAATCAAPGGAQETAHEWVTARYEAALFDDATAAWHFGSLEAGARRARVTPIGRVNWASRFGADGYQLEGDLYPVWPGVGYAYLSAGYSEGAPFPDLRAAAEVFASLPAALEASAGLVYMDFDRDEAALVVASLSSYTGNYWLSVRPSWTTGAGELSVTLVARRYLATSAEFVSLRLLAGSTPEELARRGDPGLETFGIQADAQLRLTPRWLLLPLAAAVREELAGGGDRLRFSLGAGVSYRF